MGVLLAFLLVIELFETEVIVDEESNGGCIAALAVVLAFISGLVLFYAFLYWLIK